VESAKIEDDHFRTLADEAITRVDDLALKTVTKFEQTTAKALREAVKDGKIGQPETRLGLIPGWGGTQRITRYVGLGQARRLLFSGDVISAEEALRIGLVDEVLPSADELDAALVRWFKMLAPGSPAAVARAKRALLQRDEIEEFGKCFCASDAREGTTAFIEKRKPGWATWEPQT
jgi:enoyl-CoA hydratase